MVGITGLNLSLISGFYGGNLWVKSKMKYWILWWELLG